jgi:hypothetical protein
MVAVLALARHQHFLLFLPVFDRHWNSPRVLACAQPNCRLSVVKRRSRGNMTNFQEHRHFIARKSLQIVHAYFSWFVLLAVVRRINVRSCSESTQHTNHIIEAKPGPLQIYLFSVGLITTTEYASAAMSPRERLILPKNDSFSSVEDVVDAPKKSVSFGSIQQREYNRIVGDHPDVRVGPPVTFSWEYSELSPVSVDDYESNRVPYKKLLRMSSITRKNMLRTIFDIPEEDIRLAEKEVQKIRQQRERSAKQSETSAVVESAVKRAGRKLRKNLVRSITASSKIMAMGATPIYMQA